MEWAEDYIRRCLSDIPKCEYRARLQSELTDHLKLLVGDLEATGRTTEESRSEALRQMGDARELNARYWAEWLRQPERVRWDISRFVLGILLAGAGFLCAVALMLFGDTMLALFQVVTGAAAHATPFQTFLFHLGGAFLYAAAFIPNAILLRKAFRRRKNRIAMVGGGLLLSWIVGKGSTVLYLLTAFGTEALAEGKRELTARMFAGSYDLLWFTTEYILLSLLGCVALGWLFGRYPKSALRDAARAADIWKKEGGDA